MEATARRNVALLMRLVVIALAWPAGLSIVVGRFAAGSIFKGADGGGKESEGE